jgi:hypothetical protein
MISSEIEWCNDLAYWVIMQMTKKIITKVIIRKFQRFRSWSFSVKKEFTEKNLSVLIFVISLSVTKYFSATA